MNWQIVVGILFLIGGIGNITNGFFVFLTALVIGAVFLFWGYQTLRKKSCRKKDSLQSALDDVDRQILAKESEHQAANSAPDLTPDRFMGYPRKYNYKDVAVWIVWQYGGQYGTSCESAGIRCGDHLDLVPISSSDSNGIAIYWKENHIGFMKENRMQGMVYDWKNAGLPVQAVVSFVGGESKLLVEFAFYGTPSTPHPNTKKEKRK